MHYVYILLSEKDRKFYIGYSENLTIRLKAHNSGSVTATKLRRPLKLVFYEAYFSKQDAIRREQYFKTNPGKRTLGLMLRDSVTKINYLFK